MPIDWYEEIEERQRRAPSESEAERTRGCCLLCDEAEEGCLCVECKCRQCSHYEAPYRAEDEGHCELASESREDFEAGKVLRRVRFEALLAETPKAKLIQFDATTKRWVPKSVMQGDRIQEWFLDRYQLRVFIIRWRQARLGEA
jgi:hypothetical protein